MIIIIILLLIVPILLILLSVYYQARFDKSLNNTIDRIHHILANQKDIVCPKKSYVSEVFYNDQPRGCVSIRIINGQLVINGRFLFSKGVYFTPEPYTVHIDDMPIKEFLEKYPYSVYEYHDYINEYDMVEIDINFSRVFYPILLDILSELEAQFKS